MKSLRDLIEAHDRWRSGGINLVASENLLPPEAGKALVSDLQGRYHSDWYGGTRIVRQVLQRTEEVACELFQAEQAIVTPHSGNLCDLAALFAFSEPGDGVALLPFSAGGYPMDFARFGRKRVDLPVRAGTFEPDPGGLPLPEPVKLLIAGASFIPFPHILPPLADACRPLVYDGSHVMGLLACGVFQNPLREGADALIGSTHKSLYGPQGGIVLTRSEMIASRFRAWLDFSLEGGITLIDNPHPGRIAALGIVLEMLLSDRGYGGRVVANAKALGAALDSEGVPVRFRDRGYTESHQLFLDLEPKEAEVYCGRLEGEGIFVDIGGRLGTAEVTTRGMDPDDMGGIAKRMGAVFHALRREG
ncbi:MAG: hypothetical protein ACYTHN_03545 [Planctomycetota bacterium]|jgi:glycine hydroxymethyltransferase